MRFCSLGSGSTGNGTLVESHGAAGTQRLLIDCGFSAKETEARLARAGVAPGDLDAIFITHEHGDHVGCALTLARRHRLPLWMSRGTWRAIGEPELPGLLGVARDSERIDLGAIEIWPYTVPHDALEPLQLRVVAGGLHLGVLTDVGSVTPHLLHHLQQCDALLLEFNHDLQMLAESRYPPSLKARVGGRLGHLSNDTAAMVLQRSLHVGLQRIVAGHLSQHNNHPGRVREVVSQCLEGQTAQLVIANAKQGCPWQELVAPGEARHPPWQPELLLPQ
jgi:phosphoribosyl 1,2-cyclic phosphodiesterase